MLQTQDRPASENTILPPDSTLISFPICPFVARARIVALEKGLDIKVKFIDLVNKPDWFLARSPTGTVPALDIGDAFIFESSVISEFINELGGPSMHPSSAIRRAVNRSWTEFAANLLRAQYMLLLSGSQVEFDRQRIALAGAMKKVEAALSARPFFNGEGFAIVDAAYAPLFVRNRYLLDTKGIDLLTELPKLRDWGAALIERPSVKQVHGPEHYGQLEAHMSEHGAFLRSRLV